VRIEAELMLEQEEIRADIERIANQLERLNQQIQSHVSRNTACLDESGLSKKKRRR